MKLAHETIRGDFSRALQRARCAAARMSRVCASTDRTHRGAPEHESIGHGHR